MSVAFAIATVLAIIYFVPFVIYAGASAIGLVNIPAEASPQRFLLGVLIIKLGTAAAFVLILVLGSPVFSFGWLTYALVWFAMFATSEIGDAVTTRSSWPEALLGIISEAVYAPAAALAAFAILGIN
ncbi:MAG: hypothetical protein U1E29_03650 [Coriobacteriia bacterium]|nr:hypothetical protein [Coriobacteriia bacterium]